MWCRAWLKQAGEGAAGLVDYTSGVVYDKFRPVAAHFPLSPPTPTIGAQRWSLCSSAIAFFHCSYIRVQLSAWTKLSAARLVAFPKGHQSAAYSSSTATPPDAERARRAVTPAGPCDGLEPERDRPPLVRAGRVALLRWRLPRSGHRRSKSSHNAMQHFFFSMVLAAYSLPV